MKKLLILLIVLLLLNCSPTGLTEYSSLVIISTKKMGSNEYYYIVKDISNSLHILGYPRKFVFFSDKEYKVGTIIKLKFIEPEYIDEE